MHAAAELQFGIGGNAAEYQVSGWSVPEPGYTWAVGPEAVLRVPLAPGSGDLLVDLILRPFMVPPYRSMQRVEVLVNGERAGSARAQDDSALGFRIPAARIAGRRHVDITIRMPDALRPCDANAGTDDRCLGVLLREALLLWDDPESATPLLRLPPLPVSADAIRGFTGLTPDRLMLHFESLGHNCEFGLVQRALGAEPLGLLRFVGIKIQDLLRGLDWEFEGIDDGLRPYVSAEEQPKWIMACDRYDIHRHSYKGAAEMDEVAFAVAETQKLRFERQRFLDVLQSGQNLFVYQRQESIAPEHVLPILNVLRSHGPNALLFVTLNYDAPPGSVDQIGPHLFRGNIDRLAPIGNAVDSNIPAWISICANAYRLWRLTGHGAG